jgi:hypothetical protein
MTLFLRHVNDCVRWHNCTPLKQSKVYKLVPTKVCVTESATEIVQQTICGCCGKIRCTRSSYGIITAARQLHVVGGILTSCAEIHDVKGQLRASGIRVRALGHALESPDIRNVSNPGFVERVRMVEDKLLAGISLYASGLYQERANWRKVIRSNASPSEIEAVLDKILAYVMRLVRFVNSRNRKLRECVPTNSRTVCGNISTASTSTASINVISADEDDDIQIVYEGGAADEDADVQIVYEDISKSFCDEIFNLNIKHFRKYNSQNVMPISNAD